MVAVVVILHTPEVQVKSNSSSDRNKPTHFWAVVPP